MSRRDVTGERIGCLTALEPHHVDACGRVYWLFACDCGGAVVACPAVVRERANLYLSAGCLYCRGRRAAVARVAKLRGRGWAALFREQGHVWPDDDEFGVPSTSARHPKDLGFEVGRHP